MVDVGEAGVIAPARLSVRCNMGERGATDLSDIIMRQDPAAPLRDPAAYAAF